MSNSTTSSKSNRIKVAVLAGARSTEHEVSLASAYNIVKAIDTSKYEVFVVGIDKQGVWRRYDPNNFVESPGDFTRMKLAQPISGRLTVTQSSNKFYDLDNEGKASFECDVIFPAVLGNYAEDGTMQGLLRMMDVPFTTADVLGSSVGMDKDVTYRLLQQAGVGVADFVTLRKNGPQQSYEQLSKKLGKTLFVKPANAGSSVGVSKTTNTEEFDKALTLAYRYDVKVLVQAAMVGREIEISVMGNIGGQQASVVGEIVEKTDGDFYSYDNKYIHSDNVDLIAPAKLPDGVLEKVQQTAIKVCETVECDGFARVDFFLTKDNKIYITEINTMPGFTKISMFPRLWGESGVNYPALVDKLLQYAIERHDFRIKPIVTDAEDVIRLAAGEQAMGEVLPADVSAPERILASLYRKLGQLYLKAKKPLIICIGGSVAKTSTKLALAKVLETEKRISYMDDSYNDGLGLYMSVFEQKVPTSLTNPFAWAGKLLSVLGKFLKRGPEIIILEYGIARVGTMDNLISFSRPDIALLTAVTPEHMEQLFNMDVVGQEETKLLRAARKSGFVSAKYVDEKHLKDINVPLHRYGTEESEASYKIVDWTKTGAKVDFKVGKLKLDKVDVNLIFEPQIQQLAGVALLANHLGVSEKGIREGLGRVRATPSRMSLLEGKNGSLIIDDAANFSPDAGVAAIKTMKRMPAKRRIALLGNMHELGEYEEKGFADVAAEFKDLDMLVFVGELAKKYFVAAAKKMGFKSDKNLFFFETSPEAGEWLADKLHDGDLVLIKGPFGKLYMEEAVKKMLANPEDWRRLTRQSDFWQKKKRQRFGDRLG